MTWPAPSPNLPPSAPPPDERATDEPSRHPLSAVPPAVWVAVAGGALVLLAAAIVVVGNWDVIGRGARVAGLAFTTAGLIAASERLRRVTPTTASVIAHVGTFLVASVGIATMSLSGVTWPGCLAVGGALVAIATQFQSPRWSTNAFGTGQVAGVALAATGVGALTGTTGGLIAAIAAAGLLVVGAELRAAGLAVLAVCSPALAALADAGIGAGTFERAGLVGERLSWSGPVVGALAAMVLATVAVRRSNNGVMVAAIASPLLGVVSGLAAIDGSAIAWWCLPGLIAIAAELTWWLLPGETHRALIARGIDAVGATLATATIGLAPLAAQEISAAGDTRESWAIPVTVTVFAMALVEWRWRSADRRLADLGIAALTTGLIGIGVALAAPAVWLAAIAVALTASAAWASRRLHPVAIYVPAVWAFAALGTPGPVGDWTGAIAPLGLTALLVGVLVTTRARLAAEQPWTGPVEMLTVVGVAAGTVGAVVPVAPALAALVAIAGVAAAFAVVAPQFERWIAVALAIASPPLVFALAWSDDLDLLWIAAGAATVAFGLTWSVHRLAFSASAAAAGMVATAGAALIPLAVTAEESFVLAIVAATGLTGTAIAIGRSPALFAAAATAGVMVVGVGTLGLGPAWTSFAWTVVGVQIVALGAATGRLLATGVGVVVTVGGLVSWWFTSGWNETVVDWLEPADIRTGDLWMAVAATVALAAGHAVRRAHATGSWLAHGPALAIAALWLLPVQADRSTVWAVPVALAIGVAAIGIGAGRRLAAPLIGGIALSAATAFVATGSDLRAVPAWTWFAIGGLALLGIAVVIEQTSKHDVTIGDLVDRWQ